VQLAGFALGPALLRILLILAGAVLADRFMTAAIVAGLRRKEKGGPYFEKARAETLEAVLRRLIRGGVLVLASLMVLEVLTVPIGPVLAGAGVLGLAVGFGAQGLVRDVISGFFIIYEDQYRVNEYIEAAGLSGIVEEIGLRMTKVRAFSGALHFIRNGDIGTVTNFNRGPMSIFLTVSIAYEEEIARAVKALQEACDKAAEEMQAFTTAPGVLGATALAESGVEIRIFAKTPPMEQWAAERELRVRMKTALDEAGIEIPYPHRVVVPGDAKGPGGPKRAAGG